MGRKPHIPTEKERNQVKVMIAAGMTWEIIAKVLGMSKRTLGKHYKEELTTGKAEIGAKVFGSLVNKAIAGNVTAQIFYCKTQLGMRENDGPTIENRIFPVVQYVEVGPDDELPPELAEALH